MNTQEPESTVGQPVELLKLNPRQLQNFWKKVDKNGPIPPGRPELGPCWIWTGYVDPNGYGKFGLFGKIAIAHRISWMIQNGVIRDGKHALHKCDNPPCCNPNHLFLGTQADNNRDRESKGRGVHPVGEQCGRVKLTDSLVREIRMEYATGNVSSRALAARRGVSHTMILDIAHRKNWKHI